VPGGGAGNLPESDEDEETLSDATLPFLELLLDLAGPRRTLLTRGAFDLARRAAVNGDTGSVLHWVAHGSYRCEDFVEPVEIFEVAREADGPFTPPAGIGAVRSEDDTIPGWRPAPGLEVPNRPSWVLKSKLDDRDFSETWLANHRGTHDTEVFKFCFEAERLRGLQREVTIFRLLKDALGNRRDIARILDWNFEQPPYYVEAEYSKDGTLIEWFDEQGGIEQVPLEVRLEIVAQAADALSAAHSVGVLHKDIRPESILISVDHRGRPRICLTSFGIGQITEWERLTEAKITVMGFLPEPSADDGDDDEVKPGLYLAPEVLEGKTPTMQADIYSLGVILYQLVAGDLHRALASGWQRDVEDEVLREDIAAMVDGKPERRLANAAEAAQRLRSLDKRRTRRLSEQKAAEEAQRSRIAAEQTRKGRRSGTMVGAVLGVLLLGLGAKLLRTGNRLSASQTRLAEVEAELDAANATAEAAREQVQFLCVLFNVSHMGEPFDTLEVLDQGVVWARREYAEAPLDRAAVLCSIGIAYRNLDRYERADLLLQEAGGIAEQHPGSCAPMLEIVLHERAALLHMMGRPAEAADLETRADQVSGAEVTSRTGLPRRASGEDATRSQSTVVPAGFAW
jgi:serine/threonine-protein kinase